MDALLARLGRISVIFLLTLKEAVRSRLVMVLVICCALFMLTGGGCTRACQSLTESGQQQQEEAALRIIEQENLSEAEKAEVLAELERRKQQAADFEKSAKKQLKALLLGVSYGMIAFWLFLIAVVATPFLALNDFQNRTHVMLLSRPLARWEYLSGKYLAILGMLLLNLAVLLVSYHLSMYISLDQSGFELYNGLIVFLQGIALLAALLMLVGLNAGRISSIFIVVALAGLSALPGLFLTTGLEDELPRTWRWITNVLAYGLPQLGVNFFYGLGEAMDLPGLEEQNFFKKGGNYHGQYSLLINTAWFILCWILMIVSFKRKDLDT